MKISRAESSCCFRLRTVSSLPRKDSEAAACAAAGYVLSLYRLRDTYTDYMLGEMIAVVFLPVFIWGLWEILWGNEKYWPVFSLASVAIWNSHILTCLLCAGMAGACILIRISELVTNRTRRHALLLSCMVVMMLSVCRLIPLADLWLTGVRTQPVYRDFVFYDQVLRRTQRPHWRLRDGLDGNPVIPMGKNFFDDARSN